jgi:hypothetical protein
MKTAAELCEDLLNCAEQHGEAEGSEVQVGDLEDFFRAAFDLIAPEELGRFWDDLRVAGTVQEIPEYEELAAEVHARGDFANEAKVQATRPGSRADDCEREPVTWDQLAGRIAAMTAVERGGPVQPVADRLVLVSLFLKTGEEAPDGFITATGLHYDLVEVEDVGDGDRMAWYSRRR